MDSSLGWKDNHGVGTGNSVQYSCLKNSTEESGGLQAMGCKESDITKHTHTSIKKKKIAKNIQTKGILYIMEKYIHLKYIHWDMLGDPGQVS